MNDLLKRLDETVDFIRSRTDFKPDCGIILGTGLGNLAKEIQPELVLPYTEIPNFPVSTVYGHSGNLILGNLGGKKVVAMQGRFHYYEGYSMEEVTFPVRVMKKLGISTLLISNASGGINPDFNPGDLVVYRDHINMQPENPLRGFNHDVLGPRFPDMSVAYDKELIEIAMQVAKQEQIPCHTGVYVGVPGPSLETPAEYRAFHVLGGDAIGMSTVPEVIVARHMGLKVFVIGVIANIGYPPERLEKTTHEQVVAMAATAEPKLTHIVREMIKKIEF